MTRRFCCHGFLVNGADRVQAQRRGGEIANEHLARLLKTVMTHVVSLSIEGQASAININPLPFCRGRGAYKYKIRNVFVHRASQVDIGAGAVVETLASREC